MEIKIPKEVRQHKETIFFGLTARQFLCSVLAVGVAVGFSVGLAVGWILGSTTLFGRITRSALTFIMQNSCRVWTSPGSVVSS